MRDEEIISLYFERNEQAIRETISAYGSYCRKIAGNILENEADVEEVLSDTWLRAWNAIPPQKPQYLRLFLGTVTRNLAFSRWRRSTAHKRGGGELELVLEELEGCIAAAGNVEDGLNARELEKTIRSFLDTLPERDQDIFLRRYFFVEESDAIARRYAMRPATVLKILSRTRMKLKKYLTQEGYYL